MASVAGGQLGLERAMGAARCLGEIQVGVGGQMRDALAQLLQQPEDQCPIAVRVAAEITAALQLALAIDQGQPELLRLHRAGLPHPIVIEPHEVRAFAVETEEQLLVALELAEELLGECEEGLWL